jgi:hypothetical protein
MNVKNLKAVGLLALLVVLLAVTGCTGKRVRVGKLQTESRSVELGGARSVQVEIEMAAGELEVSGGAGELLEADFKYNVAELKPEVEYSGGTLTVQTPDVDVTVGSLWDLDDYRYEWDLRLNDAVPMEMSVEMGAGRTDLALGTLSLTRLDVKRGAGEVHVDLSGASSLTRLEIRGGAGRFTVDLTGDWQTDLDADIEGGLGEITVRLPRSVGVRVDVQVGIGAVNASGLTKDGDDYVNDAYGESDVTLRIDIRGGVGAINLELGE